MGHTKNFKGHFYEKNIVPLLTLHWPHPIAKKAGGKNLLMHSEKRKVILMKSVSGTY